jgi:hypothetical protein
MFPAAIQCVLQGAIACSVMCAEASSCAGFLLLCVRVYACTSVSVRVCVCLQLVHVCV